MFILFYLFWGFFPKENKGYIYQGSIKIIMIIMMIVVDEINIGERDVAPWLECPLMV